jgi:hypothetical protein
VIASVYKCLAGGILLLIVLVQFSQAQPIIQVRGGNPLMSITTGIPGGQPIPVTNTTTRLDYRRSRITTKITVTSNCPGQKFTLKVLATGVTVGIPAPEVTLSDGMPSTNFITNIPPGSSGILRCTLRYTASATFDQGNSLELGNDVHLVTYTIVAQ